MLITLDDYEQRLARYYLYDCAVRSKDIFVFMADRWYSDEEVEEEEENDGDPAFRDKRAITYFRNKKPGEQWAKSQFEGWGRMQIGAASKPLNQFLAVELGENRVYVLGSGEKDKEKLDKSLPNNPNRGGIWKIKTLNGYAYVCGGARSIGKRVGKGEWFSHSKDIPYDYEKDGGSDAGFEDFDGFSEDDIYAAGGKGDVWHYDGKQWRQIAFPTNTWVQTVCCGSDGNVYISCYEGLTFMGRENRWKKIHDGGIYLGWRDMVWYEDRAWATSENGLWTIHNGKASMVEGLPSEIRVCSGNLYVNDGVLLMAGMGGAAFRENGQWHSIFVRGIMEKQLRERRAGGKK